MSFDFFRSGSISGMLRAVSAGAVCVALLQGCGGGGGDADTGNATAPGANRAPSISGTPATGVQPGQSYSFTPSAADPDGDTLSFSILNKPDWATFSASTGALTGTPTAAGSYANVTISASDGRTTTALTAFTITVGAPAGTGSATIAWLPPTTQTDGNELNNLAGYRINYRRANGGGAESITIPNPGISSYVIENLGAGTYFFSVVAFDASGVESTPSGEVSKTIG